MHRGIGIVTIVAGDVAVPVLIEDRARRVDVHTAARRQRRDRHEEVPEAVAVHVGRFDVIAESADVVAGQRDRRRHLQPTRAAEVDVDATLAADREIIVPVAVGVPHPGQGEPHPRIRRGADSREAPGRSAARGRPEVDLHRAHVASRFRRTHGDVGVPVPVHVPDATDNVAEARRAGVAVGRARREPRGRPGEDVRARVGSHDDVVVAIAVHVARSVEVPPEKAAIRQRGVRYGRHPGGVAVVDVHVTKSEGGDAHVVVAVSVDVADPGHSLAELAGPGGVHERGRGARGEARGPAQVDVDLVRASAGHHGLPDDHVGVAVPVDVPRAVDRPAEAALVGGSEERRRGSGRQPTGGAHIEVDGGDIRVVTVPGHRDVVVTVPVYVSDARHLVRVRLCHRTDQRLGRARGQPGRGAQEDRHLELDLHEDIVVPVVVEVPRRQTHPRAGARPEGIRDARGGPGDEARGAPAVQVHGVAIRDEELVVAVPVVIQRRVCVSGDTRNRGGGDARHAAGRTRVDVDVGPVQIAHGEVVVPVPVEVPLGDRQPHGVVAPAQRRVGAEAAPRGGAVVHEDAFQPGDRDVREAVSVDIGASDHRMSKFVGGDGPVPGGRGGRRHSGGGAEVDGRAAVGVGVGADEDVVEPVSVDVSGGGERAPELDGR